jgi:hypothetical protein
MDNTKFPKIFNERNKGLALINFRRFWYFVKLIVAQNKISTGDNNNLILKLFFKINFVMLYILK